VNPVQAFAVGIAPDHVPALVAALTVPIVVYAVRRLRTSAPPAAAPATTPPAMATARVPAARHSVRSWAAWALGVSAAVHLALPLGHSGAPVLAIGFVASGAAYLWLAIRAWDGRSWRLWSALLVLATLVGYVVVMAQGGEEPDQVGIATALDELIVLGLCLVPVRALGRPRRFARAMGSFGTVFVSIVVGIVIWAGSIAAHAATDTDVTADPQDATGAVADAGGHEHSHDHTARAQAGVIMRPATSEHPTLAQQRAAAELAEATRVATRRYVTLDAALAAGYALPKVRTGADVHVENKAFATDGRVLDPQRPEMLVYVIGGGKATLLGVVFVMPRAGMPGPEPGGPITRWHAHNICLTALPPGFGIVSPFGSCPALSIALTSPEMMHLWVVDNPAGAFAEGIDKQWATTYNAGHGSAYPPQ
jgi:hypothetical protein